MTRCKIPPRGFPERLAQAIYDNRSELLPDMRPGRSQDRAQVDLQMALRRYNTKRHAADVLVRSAERLSGLAAGNIG